MTQSVIQDTEQLAQQFRDCNMAIYGVVHPLDDSLENVIQALMESDFSLVADFDLDAIAGKTIGKVFDLEHFYTALQTKYPTKRISMGYDGSTIYATFASEDSFRTYVLHPITSANTDDEKDSYLFALTHKRQLKTDELGRVLDA